MSDHFDIGFDFPEQLPPGAVPALIQMLATGTIAEHPRCAAKAALGILCYGVGVLVREDAPVPIGVDDRFVPTDPNAEPFKPDPVLHSLFTSAGALRAAAGVDQVPTDLQEDELIVVPLAHWDKVLDHPHTTCVDAVKPGEMVSAEEAGVAECEIVRTVGDLERVCPAAAELLIPAEQLEKLKDFELQCRAAQAGPEPVAAFPAWLIPIVLQVIQKLLEKKSA